MSVSGGSMRERANVRKNRFMPDFYQRHQDEEIRHYLSTFSYNLDEVKVSAMGEYFRMAYYLGILNDIPDIKFFRKE